MNRSAALDTMLFWPSQGSCDIMPHSHAVSKTPWGPRLPLPTNECFHSLHSRTRANASLLRGCSSPFSPLEMLSSVRIGMLEEHVFTTEDHRRYYQNPTISRASLVESHRWVLGEQRCRSLLPLSQQEETLIGQSPAASSIFLGCCSKLITYHLYQDVIEFGKYS